MTYYMGEVRGFGMSGCSGFEKSDTFYKITWGRDDSWGESGIPNLTKLTKLRKGGVETAVCEGKGFMLDKYDKITRGARRILGMVLT